MSKSKKRKRGRIDFTIEQITPIGRDKEGSYYRIRMVPDKRSWERTEIKGEKGYLNKFDKGFIPDKEFAKSVKTMKNIPITITHVRIGKEQEYIEKSRKRVKKESK